MRGALPTARRIPLRTPLLISHLTHLERSGTRVRNVINLLVEDLYSNALEWTEINARWPVLHQRFEKTSGREAGPAVRGA